MSIFLLFNRSWHISLLRVNLSKAVQHIWLGLSIHQWHWESNSGLQNKSGFLVFHALITTYSDGNFYSKLLWAGQRSSAARCGPQAVLSPGLLWYSKTKKSPDECQDVHWPSLEQIEMCEVVQEMIRFCFVVFVSRKPGAQRLQSLPAVRWRNESHQQPAKEMSCSVLLAGRSLNSTSKLFTALPNTGRHIQWILEMNVWKCSWS